MRVFFTPKFIKMVSSLPLDLQAEVYEKVELFKDPTSHQNLKVHKLQGSLKDFYSFSVTYKTRIIFEKMDEGAILHAVGDHDVYKS